MKGTNVVSFQDLGQADWQTANENFEAISEDVDELDGRINRLDKRTSVQTVTYLIESEGYVTVLTAKEHSNLAMRLVHGFVVAGDNVKENVTIHVLRTNRDLCDSVTLKSTEKSGKAQSFTPFKMQVIGKMEDVKIYSNSRRKVIVTLIFKPEER